LQQDARKVFDDQINGFERDTTKVFTATEDHQALADMISEWRRLGPYTLKKLSMARAVIVDGKVIVDDGKLTTIDERKLLRDVQKTGEEIWARIPENHYLKQTADEVSPLAFKLWDEK